jgi:DNA-binding NarL/FixJ family response regulator
MIAFSCRLRFLAGCLLTVTATRQVPDYLSLSLDTVRFHIRNFYERLHAHSKSQAVLKALRSGLIS